MTRQEREFSERVAVYRNLTREQGFDAALSHYAGQQVLSVWRHTMGIAATPDVVFERRGPNGSTIRYGHIYWRPLIVHVLGHTIIGRRRLRQMWADQEGER